MLQVCLMTDEKNISTFEQSLNKLESLVQKMESGNLSLEESLKAFEQGVKLTRKCQTALITAEQKVEKLLDSNGKIESQSFDQPLKERE